VSRCGVRGLATLAKIGIGAISEPGTRARARIAKDLNVRARGADGHLGIDKGLAGVCPAISVVTAT
jgi:hypothetical protein